MTGDTTSTQTKEPQADSANGQEEALPRMSLGDHLDELRRRLFICVIAVAICVFGMLPFKPEVTTVFKGPYDIMWVKAYVDFVEQLEERVKVAGGIAKMHPIEQQKVEFHRKYKQEILEGKFPKKEYDAIYRVGGFQLRKYLTSNTPLADFWIFMAASILLSLMLASPVVVYQVWAFIAAGLYSKEKHAVYRVVPLSMSLMIGGILFGYFLVVPYGLYFLTQIMDWDEVAPLFTVGDYFKLFFMLTIALAVVFQLPIFMLVVQKTGLMTHQSFKKNWRWIILGFFVFGAVLTPPDPFTQMLMACPMIVLYLLGLFLTSRVEKSQKAKGMAWSEPS